MNNKLTPEQLQEIREQADFRATSGRLWPKMVRDLLKHIDFTEKKLKKLTKKNRKFKKQYTLLVQIIHNAHSEKEQLESNIIALETLLKLTKNENTDFRAALERIKETRKLSADAYVIACHALGDSNE